MKRTQMIAALALILMSSPTLIPESRANSNQSPGFWASFPAPGEENEALLLRFRDEILAAAGLEGGLEGLNLAPELARSPLTALAVRSGEDSQLALAFRNMHSSRSANGWKTIRNFQVWSTENFPPAEIETLIDRSEKQGPPPPAQFSLEMDSRWMGLPRPDSDKTVALPGGSLGQALASIPHVAVQGTISGEVKMTMKADLPSPAEAAIIADAWNSVFAGFRNNSSGAQQVLKSLGRSAVRHQGRSVEIQVPLTIAALERLQRAQASRRFLLWQQLGYQREANERSAELFEALGVAPGARLADLGAGQGFYTVRLARAVGPSGKVFAVDISEGVLNRLRERVKMAGFDQVKVIEGQEDNPRLAGKQLDGILIVNAYHEMSAYEKILGHLKKALRPGGKLVLLEPYSPEKEKTGRAEQTEDHQIAPELVAAELEEAGFEVLAVDREFTGDPHEDHVHHNGLVIARRPVQQPGKFLNP